MQEAKVQIRKITANDFNTIYHFVNLLEETTLEFYSFQIAFNSNIMHPDFIYLLAEEDNKPLGYISCHSQRLLHHGGSKIGEIQELFVNPESRNLGVGKILVEALKQEAKAMGILQLEVTSNNKRLDTHRFYIRESFVQTHQKFTFEL